MTVAAIDRLVHHATILELNTAIKPWVFAALLVLHVASSASGAPEASAGADTTAEPPGAVLIAALVVMGP